MCVRKSLKKKKVTKLEIIKNGIHMADMYWLNPAEGVADQCWDWLWETCPCKNLL